MRTMSSPASTVARDRGVGGADGAGHQLAGHPAGVLDEADRAAQGRLDGERAARPGACGSASSQARRRSGGPVRWRDKHSGLPPGSRTILNPYDLDARPGVKWAIISKQLADDLRNGVYLCRLSSEEVRCLGWPICRDSSVPAGGLESAMKSTSARMRPPSGWRPPSRGVAWMGSWWCCWSWSRSPRGGCCRARSTRSCCGPGRRCSWPSSSRPCLPGARGPGERGHHGAGVAGGAGAGAAAVATAGRAQRGPGGTAALPGCECASVPVAGRLAARGVQPAAAVAFMLAAPAVNPIVLVATAVAFPGQPQMVLARSWARC